MVRVADDVEYDDNIFFQELGLPASIFSGSSMPMNRM